MEAVFINKGPLSEISIFIYCRGQRWSSSSEENIWELKIHEKITDNQPIKREPKIHNIYLQPLLFFMSTTLH